MLAQSFVATLRWRLIGQIIGVTLAFGRALRIVFIGVFFNQTLPSSIGGDAVRVWMVMQEGARLGKSVNVVLSDRVVALLVLIGLMGAALPLLFTRVPDPVVKTAMSALVAGGVVAMGIFLVAGERIAAVLRRWRVSRPLGELASDFRALFRNVSRASQICFWSLVLHMMTITIIYVLGRSLGAEIAFLDCFIIVPVVVLVTTLPVSVAGWGVRESAMVVGFSQVGMASADALAISICFGLTQIAVGLPGGLLWLVDRKRGQPPQTG
jgi:uncharacterized protein (TIRG00374 family)